MKQESALWALDMFVGGSDQGALSTETSSPWTTGGAKSVLILAPLECQGVRGKIVVVIKVLIMHNMYV